MHYCRSVCLSQRLSLWVALVVIYIILCKVGAVGLPVHWAVTLSQDVLNWEVKPILISDKEKELVCHREEQRKLKVNDISETFVKNTFNLLQIRVLY